MSMVETPSQTSLPCDYLLEALVYITQYYGHARSAHTLIAGLPVETNVTPELFCQAAERSGYKANIVKREFDQIPSLVLPSVLILQDNKACILLSEKDGVFTAYFPESKVETEISTTGLKSQYSGYAIFIQPLPESELTDQEKNTDLSQHWFWSVMWDNRGIYLRVLLAAILINLFALTSPLFMMNVYDRVIPNSAIETGWVLGIGALSIFFFDFVIRILRGYFIDLASRRADVILHRKIYDQVLDIKLSSRSRSTGAFANNLKDFDTVKDFITSATLTGLVDLPFSLLFLLVIWTIAGPAAYILFALLVIAISVGLILQIPLKKLVRKSLQSAEAKHGILVETLNGLETIKSISGEGRFRARYSAYVGENAAWGQKSRFWSALGVNIATWLQQMSGVLLVLVGMYLVREGDLSVGGLIASVILGSRAISPIGQVAGLVTRFHHAAGALKHLEMVMSMPTERPHYKNFLHRPDLKGAFEFQNVSFHYTDQSQKVLENISLIIQPGQKIGIVGRIGSGKSSLTKLATGLYDATEGTVLVDGTDIRQIDPVDLRQNIGWVGQDTLLFNGSLRDNITAGKPHATDEEVLEVAKLSGVHEFARRHPMGYDMPIGERGEGLSGGQRQAVALARALLMDPPILILDEPTNSMDNQSELLLINGLKDRIKNKTVILVTHRNSLLNLIDRLLIMDNGKLIMDGPKEEVIDALNSGKVKVQGPSMV